MASLLAKFRIEYSDLIVITDVMTKAKDSTREFFENLIKEYKKTNDGIADDGMCALAQFLFIINFMTLIITNYRLDKRR